MNGCKCFHEKNLINFYFSSHRLPNNIYLSVGFEVAGIELRYVIRGSGSNRADELHSNKKFKGKKIMQEEIGVGCVV